MKINNKWNNQNGKSVGEYFSFSGEESSSILSGFCCIFPKKITNISQSLTDHKDILY